MANRLTASSGARAGGKDESERCFGSGLVAWRGAAATKSSSVWRSLFSIRSRVLIFYYRIGLTEAASVANASHSTSPLPHAKAINSPMREFSVTFSLENRCSNSVRMVVSLERKCPA